MTHGARAGGPQEEALRSNVAGRFPVSTAVFQLKCESGEQPRILTETALRLSKEPIERVVRAAQSELDLLHRTPGRLRVNGERAGPEVRRACVRRRHRGDAM